MFFLTEWLEITWDMQGKDQTSAGDCNAEQAWHLKLPPLQAVSLYLTPVTPETFKKKRKYFGPVKMSHATFLEVVKYEAGNL